MDKNFNEQVTCLTRFVNFSRNEKNKGKGNNQNNQNNNNGNNGGNQNQNQNNQNQKQNWNTSGSLAYQAEPLRSPIHSDFLFSKTPDPEQNKALNKVQNSQAGMGEDYANYYKNFINLRTAEDTVASSRRQIKDRRKLISDQDSLDSKSYGMGAGKLRRNRLFRSEDDTMFDPRTDNRSTLEYASANSGLAVKRAKDSLWNITNALSGFDPDSYVHKREKLHGYNLQKIVRANAKLDEFVGDENNAKTVNKYTKGEDGISLDKMTPEQLKVFKSDAMYTDKSSKISKQLDKVKDSELAGRAIPKAKSDPKSEPNHDYETAKANLAIKQATLDKKRSEIYRGAGVTQEQIYGKGPESIFDSTKVEDVKVLKAHDKREKLVDKRNASYQKQKDKDATKDAAKFRQARGAAARQMFANAGTLKDSVLNAVSTKHKMNYMKMYGTESADALKAKFAHDILGDTSMKVKMAAGYGKINPYRSLVLNPSKKRATRNYLAGFSEYADKENELIMEILDTEFEGDFQDMSEVNLTAKDSTKISEILNTSFYKVSKDEKDYIESLTRGFAEDADNAYDKFLRETASRLDSIY